MIQLWQGIEFGRPALAQAADGAARFGYNWASVLAFLVMGAVFVGIALGLGWLLRPHMPSPEKGSIYECGERPIGRAWFQFNPRFYIVALIFVIFEVEIAFMIPVASVYRGWAQGVSGTQAEATEKASAARVSEELAAKKPVDEAIAAAAVTVQDKMTADRASWADRRMPDKITPDTDTPSPWVAFVELFVFVAILTAGLAYVWAKGDLEWVRRLKGVRQEPPRRAADLVQQPVPAAEPARQPAA